MSLSPLDQACLAPTVGAVFTEDGELFEVVRASCSLHVPAALREHHRPVADAMLDALFADTLDDAHPHRASDGSLVVWLSPPSAARDVAEAYARACDVELVTTCSLCVSSSRCPVHTEVSP